MTVIDASITVRMLLGWKEDELLRQRFAGADRTLHAPAHLDTEVLSAVVGMLRGAKIEEPRARRMAGQFRNLRITRHHVAPMGDRLVSLRHNFTVYDAAYIALSEVLQQPLLTSDGKFARAPAGSHTAEIHTYPG